MAMRKIKEFRNNADFMPDWSGPRHSPNAPANDAPRFRTPKNMRPPPRPSFGQKPIPRVNPVAPRLPIGGLRMLPWVGFGLAAVDLLDGYFYPRRNPNPIKAPSGWNLVRECLAGPPPSWPGTYRVSRTVNTGGTVDACIGGQAVSNIAGAFVPPNGLFLDPSESSVGWWWPQSAASDSRSKHWRSYRRVGAARVGREYATYTPWLAPPVTPWENPNFVRNTPGSQPVPDAPPSVPDPLPPLEWQWSNVPKGYPLPRPHVRRPPPSGTEEHKVRSKWARIGIAVYRVLDQISESAEIVDAIYDSLPKAVRKRWEKGRKNRAFVDQMGQYGIDGADWKAEAIAANWHLVDARVSLKNIVKNHLEDQIIGGWQRAMPKQVINAFEKEVPGGNSVSPEMGVSNFVDWLFGD